MNIILPSYTAIIPSTGKQVSFRPFTVKEEKSLLLALQEDTLNTVANAIKSTVKACTYNAVDPDQHPYYDIESLFLDIRSKSVGEVIEMIGSCECSETAKTDFSVDIASKTLVPAIDPKAGTIVIPDSIYTIKIRHPTITDFVAATEPGADSSRTVANCVVSVYSEDEVFNWTLEEKIEFVDSMTPKQQVEIVKFLDNMPMVHLDVSYTCSKCGKRHEEVITGFENFFV